MPYRVEAAVSGRAGCQQSECKNAGIKIEKDELRFGTWVEFEDRGSWRWKHWGCVTGKQLQNLRADLDPEGTGNYQFDRLDGYDSEDKGSLDKYPDLQEKVRGVITQGFIDPEDFNGDAEMNKLGETGIRTAESKKKMREEAKARTNEIADLQAQLAAAQAERDALKEDSAKKPAGKKRGRAKEESDDEDAFEESKPAPKKRATKVKKEETDADDETAEVNPKPKGGRKKAVKEEIDHGQNVVNTSVEGSEVAKPKSSIKRGRKKAVKEEAVGEENGIDHAPEVETKPAVKRGRKSAIKEEVVDEQNGVPDAPKVTKSEPVAKNGRKKAVKKEEDENDAQGGVDEEVKGEPVEASSSLSAIAPVSVKREDAQTTKGAADSKLAQHLEVAAKENAEAEAQPKKKGRRVKSGDLKTASETPTSARGSRSRAASKK